ncbi:MAG: S9 family peptidase [Ignavibacteria bacterium]|nr:S9 family peptidase [Ignavibacteria bacterium]
MPGSKSPRVRKLTVEQFFAIRSISGFSLSEKNNEVYYITNTTGIPQIWVTSLKGGVTKQISIWPEAVREVHHNPKTNDIIFISDNNGDEQTQIYSMPDKGGEVLHLSEGFENSQTLFISFNKKGDKYLFATNKRLDYNFDNYIKDLKTGENILVKSFEDEYPTHASEWSSNERYIIFEKVYGNMNMDLLLFDTKDGSLKNITEHDLSVNTFYGNIHFDKNNKGFYYLTDEGREFKGIKYYNIKSGKSEWVITENWDIVTYNFSKDFKNMSWIINKNGSHIPKIKNLKNGKIKKLKLKKETYSGMRFSEDAKKLVYMCNSPLVPTEIFVYDLNKDKKHAITDSLIGNISDDAFTEPKDIFYKSFDGLSIHSLLYIPKGTMKDGTNPAILWPHGGPEASEMHNFNKYLQVFTNAGYIVIAPNFRGSIGYGKSFQKMIYKDWGGAELQDVLGAVDYLKETGYADPKKIAVVGGSFGGFMTLTCVTKAPKIWKCAIDIFGPSNLFTFLESVPEHWKQGTDILVGNAKTDKAMLTERSPINFVDNIKCPLLVIQGKYDPRVVEAESVQIVEKLKSVNKPVEYLLLEDEGHGFSKVSNQIKVFKLMLNFLDKYLK